ncbi:hypothetical protein QE152_g26116 [Popillia japonica]|uniref:Uncharacterized protein n=1 Tax=Popillia japonica TaxID=7064 RepID=A0AAW1JXR8_POPJA
MYKSLQAIQPQRECAFSPSPRKYVPRGSTSPRECGPERVRSRESAAPGPQGVRSSESAAPIERSPSKYDRRPGGDRPAGRGKEDESTRPGATQR